MVPDKGPPKDMPRFRPFPESLRWSSILSLNFICLATGLTQTATAAIAGGSLAGRVAGITTMAALGVALSIPLRMLRHFQVAKSCNHDMWKPTQSDANLDDPLFRLLARARLKLGLQPVHRLHGGYEKAQGDAAEPERTERLLAAPFAHVPRRPGDAYEAASIWLFQARGDLSHANRSSFFAFQYLFTKLVIQLILASLLGVGSGLRLQPRTVAASVQAILVGGTQVAYALFLLLLQPNADRLMNTVTALQFGVEAASTLMLYAGSFIDSKDAQAGIQIHAFYLSLVSVALPIAKMIYDSLLKPAVNLCRSRQKVDPRAVAYGLINLALFWWRAISKLFGCNVGSGAVGGGSGPVINVEAGATVVASALNTAALSDSTFAADHQGHRARVSASEVDDQTEGTGATENQSIGPERSVGAAGLE